MGAIDARTLPPAGGIPVRRARVRASGRRALVAAWVAFAGLAGLAGLAGPATPAAFAETPDDTARRMDDRLFFVQSLGRGWEPFLADVARTAEELPPEHRPPVLRVRDRAAETYADLRLREGTEASESRAYDLLDLLTRDAVDVARRPGFGERCSGIDVARATRFEAAGREDDALAAAHRAVERTPGYEPAFEFIARLTVKQAAKAEALDDWFGALEILEKGLRELPASSAARTTIDDRRTNVLTTTGAVAVDWLGDPQTLLRVQGGRSDFRAATLEFRPAAGQKAPPAQSVARPIRVRNGRYDVVARGDRGGEQRAGSVEVDSQGTRVVLLPVLPDGMVLVPAAGSLDAFLIDRTEVSNGDFRRFLGRSGGSDDLSAAAGVSFRDAQAYAKAAGKELPSYDQWKTAAFGAPGAASPRYPWGDQEGQPGVHFQGGLQAAGPVDACPAGASRFGVLNMAGNVWEWLADGWVIGGGFRRSSLEATMRMSDESEWTARFVHDRAPSEDVYQALPDDQRGRYFTYRARDESTMAQIGLRCVVPLGKPRRQP